MLIHMSLNICTHGTSGKKSNNIARVEYLYMFNKRHSKNFQLPKDIEDYVTYGRKCKKNKIKNKSIQKKKG